MPTVITSGVILGLLLATAYGAGFHFVLGGQGWHIIAYLLVAWFGFATGHFLGDFLNFEYLKIGAIHLFAASVGCWIALFATRWLLEH